MSDGIKRRTFLKVLGVSGAGAGMVGCSTDEVERLLPYVVPPEDVTPGIATWYTSVCQECSAQCGMWVRTREGRVVKAEGNPRHPVSNGALCARGQSSVQGLYNPDRFTQPMIREGGELRPATWEEAEARVVEALGSTSGDILMLTGRLGPTMEDLADQFVASVGGERVEHEGLSMAPLREAARIAYGVDEVPRFDFESANFVLSFGADFLETWLSPVAYGRGFARAAGIGPDGSKAPFVMVGPRLGLTGENADEWVPIRPGAEAAVALGMASLIASARGVDAGPYTPILQDYDATTAAEAAGIEASVIEDLAERFMEAGPGLAVGPGVSGHHRNATASNLAVLLLNHVAGNVGRTVMVDGGPAGASARPFGEMESAIRSMAGGNVGVVLVHGTNPAYSLPATSQFADAFQAVELKVALASSPDETTALADVILPDRHFLEAWGDSNPAPGVYAVQQPAMQPVPHFDTRPAGDVLLSLASQAGQDLGVATTYDHLRERWGQLHGSLTTEVGFDEWWRGVLRTGLAEVPVEGEPGAPALRSPDVALTFDPPEMDGEGEMALIVYPSSRFGDGGQLTNRPWLLELPDPVSKLAWHSWVEMHPSRAESLGVENGDMIRVTSPHGTVEAPLWAYPGIREDAVAISMGMGHENTGRYSDGKGVNPMALLPAVAEQPSGALVTLATRVDAEPTGDRYTLASIEGSDDQSDRDVAPALYFGALGGQGEDHGETAMEEPAGAVATQEDEYEEEGDYGRKELQLGGGFVPVEAEDDPSAYPLPGAQYGNYADPEDTPRWAMAIDLDKCTGCSACVVACQAENNVAWVGEDDVAMGRDLAWIRLERYYETVDASHAGTVDVRHLPMLCQHCGNAPCEPVCPVYAAYHTPDGLNGQVYNRCVGTRYCANNCPYKVRVFNWYTYTDVPEPLHWQYNPDVTVRQNGVMEKCSFCVQRIRDAGHRAVLEDRGVHPDEVVPACQQSCPAEAIVFGNIRDPESRVAQVVESERTYRVHNYLLNTQPAVSYLKKVAFHEVDGGGH
jgi:molybdopterin-containing oxidoreductase family iron-sulfur binding subunit